MKPKKSLGQHFLKSRFHLRLIAKNLEIKKDDVILEIGAGEGNLTKFLKKAKKIIAIEIDPKLIEKLKEKRIENLEIIEKDIREIDLEALIKKYQINKICGNIPYYLSGFLLRKILELENLPEILVFLLQKELAQKIAGKEKENFLSLAFKLIGEVKIVALVEKNHFFPKPKVDSAILKIKFFSSQKPVKFKKNFYEFLKLGFRQPRKFLISNLKEKYPQKKLEEVFKTLNFPLNLRAHQLKLNQWLDLFKKIEEKK